MSENRPIPLEQLAQVLLAMGCPADKCHEMARQLDRRASQLIEKQPGKDYQEALTICLG